MKRGTKIVAAVLVAVFLLLAGPGANLTASAASTDDHRLVVIVLAPYMTWDDVMGGDMPVTRALAQSGAVGDINNRASSSVAGDSNQTLSSLAISASSASAYDAEVASAYSINEHYEMGSAADAYHRVMGGLVGKSAIVYLGLPKIDRANAKARTTTRVGSLGQAITDAGGVTAALGNSDWGYEVKQTWQSRPAALIAMDESGKVAFGDVSSNVLENDEDAPYGTSTDVDVMSETYRQVRDRMSVSDGPGLVVVDPGDGERAARFSSEVSDEVASRQHNAAMKKTDAIVKMVKAGLPSNAVLMIVSQIQERPETGPVGFAPVIVSGSGWRGLIESPSTHRTGITTDLDVAPTVLAQMDIKRPVEMVGNSMLSDGSAAALSSRVATLRSLDRTAIAVDTVRGYITSTYIALVILLLVAGTVLLLLLRRQTIELGARLSSIFRSLLLAVLCIPVSSMLMYLVEPRPSTPLAIVVLFLGVLMFVWLVVLLINRRYGCDAALISAAGLTSVVIMVDQIFGAPLSYSGIFSYSPLWGSRYYGMGNEGASILVGAALVCVALLFDRYEHAHWLSAAKRWAVPLVGVAVVVTSAAPFLGANVGVAVWGFVAFAVMWFDMNGYRLSWKTALVALSGIVAVIAAFSGYDLLINKAGGQTHLARAWESAQSGGLIQLWDIVTRKAATNARVLQASNWSYLLVAILFFMAYMRWKPHGDFKQALGRHPSFATALTAALLGSLAGYFTEDSGIVIPALVMLYLAGALLCLMLESAVRELQTHQ